MLCQVCNNLLKEDKFYTELQHKGYKVKVQCYGLKCTSCKIPYIDYQKKQDNLDKIDKIKQDIDYVLEIINLLKNGYMYRRVL